MNDKDAVENILYEKFKPWAYLVHHNIVYVSRDNISFVQQLLHNRGYGYFLVKEKFSRM